METLNNPLIWANFILWIVGTALILIIGMIVFRLSQKTEIEQDEAQKKHLLTWGYFFLILVISNVLILLWRFAISNSFFLDILERCANALFYTACFIKVFDIEKRGMKKKRYFFSYIIGIIIILNLVVSPSLLKTISPLQIAFICIVTLGYSVFPIIYFLVSRQAMGEVRGNALKVSAGAIFLALGYLFRPENLVAYRITPFLNTVIDCFYITCPISIIIGILLIYESFRKGQ